MLEFKLAIALEDVMFSLKLLDLYPAVIDMLEFKLAIAWKIVFSLQLLHLYTAGARN